MRKFRFALHNPRFGGKTPGRIESVQVIDRARAHRRRIFALAKRCRNALHYACGNWSDKTLGGAMHMAAEDSDYPVAALQSLTQSQHAVRRFEMEALRANHHLERRMMSENRDRFGRLRVNGRN